MEEGGCPLCEGGGRGRILKLPCSRSGVFVKGVSVREFISFLSLTQTRVADVCVCACLDRALTELYLAFVSGSGFQIHMLGKTLPSVRALYFGIDFAPRSFALSKGRGTDAGMRMKYCSVR